MNNLAATYSQIVKLDASPQKNKTDIIKMLFLLSKLSRDAHDARVRISESVSSMEAAAPQLIGITTTTESDFEVVEISKIPRPPIETKSKSNTKRRKKNNRKTRK